MSKLSNPTALKTQLERISSNALGAVVEEFGRVLTEKIESSEWSWPNETKRRNGAVVTSPRDIVDLGNLRDSQTLAQLSFDRYQFAWDPKDPKTGFPYAIIAHEGGNGKPPRRWTESALAEFDFEGALAREIRKRV